MEHDALAQPDSVRQAVLAHLVTRGQHRDGRVVGVEREQRFVHLPADHRDRPLVCQVHVEASGLTGGRHPEATSANWFRLIAGGPCASSRASRRGAAGGECAGGRDPRRADRAGAQNGAPVKPSRVVWSPG
jgi:hypothetical protein